MDWVVLLWHTFNTSNKTQHPQEISEAAVLILSLPSAVTLTPVSPNSAVVERKPLQSQRPFEVAGERSPVLLLSDRQTLCSKSRMQPTQTIGTTQQRMLEQTTKQTDACIWFPLCLQPACSAPPGAFTHPGLPSKDPFPPTHFLSGSCCCTHLPTRSCTHLYWLLCLFWVLLCSEPHWGKSVPRSHTKLLEIVPLTRASHNQNASNRHTPHLCFKRPPWNSILPTRLGILQGAAVLQQ